jgi:hypothetical protein
LDIQNINLLSTLLVHAQYQGYWSELGMQCQQEIELLLERHLLSGLIEASWVRTDDPKSDDDDRFFAALQELMAYAFEESVRIKKKGRLFPRWHEIPVRSSRGILQEVQSLLHKYRSELVRQSRLLGRGDPAWFVLINLVPRGSTKNPAKSGIVRDGPSRRILVEKERDHDFDAAGASVWVERRTSYAAHRLEAPLIKSRTSEAFASCHAKSITPLAVIIFLLGLCILAAAIAKSRMTGLAEESFSMAGTGIAVVIGAFLGLAACWGWRKASLIKSDWVRAEAGRAKAEGKLIPVKTDGLTYGDIPLPFGEMHTENISSTDLIRAAIVAQLAKPALTPSTFFQITGLFKYQVLTWIGIIGSAITLFANLSGVLNLADWARELVAHWHEWNQIIWGSVFSFIKVKVPKEVSFRSLRSPPYWS